MTLFPAELHKVWGQKLFVLSVATLALINLMFLWFGTRPTGNQAPGSAYIAVNTRILGMTMEEKGSFLHSKLDESEGLLKIANYYQEIAYGNGAYLQNYREENRALFENYEEKYIRNDYELYTDNLRADYSFFYQLCMEYDTTAQYKEFLSDIQTKAEHLSSISIFQSDKTGYDLKNIDLTAQAYASLDSVTIDYFPQKGLYTAISYTFTDLILLLAMMLLALIIIRREKDCGLLSLVRSLPGGRLKTAIAKLVAFAVSLFVLLVLFYGVNLIYCGMLFGLGPLNRSIQSVPALIRCTMNLSVFDYLGLFLLIKWGSSFLLGVWVMLIVLVAKRAPSGWIGAVFLPLLMLGVRIVVPSTSRLNVIKYANLISLMQTNEVLGTYRNLYWFGKPIGLPLVEGVAAVLYGILLILSFCLVFTQGQLPTSGKASFSLALQRKRTKATSIYREEIHKLFVLNGVLLVIIAFVSMGIYQGITRESYLDADEIYYAYYMKPISGPYTEKSRDWLLGQGKEFEKMLEVQRQVAANKLDSNVMIMYNALQQKYKAYQKVIAQNINYYLKEHPNAWLVYESGYRILLGFTGQNDLQDLVFAGVMCAICFSGLFSMERNSGMYEILCSSPRGRKYTVRSKLVVSAFTVILIVTATYLPHLIEVLRNYGLPAMLAPAMSLSEFESIPAAFTLSDILIFCFICRTAACSCMGAITLILGHKIGNHLLTLCVSVVYFCLPALLSVSGMTGGIEWLSFWPLFHVAALLTAQESVSMGSVPYNYAWVAIFLLFVVSLITIIIATRLQDYYEWKGID